MERFFVSRPIFAICIALAIVLLGAISIFDLSIEQYPDITPPVVEVTASYSGADAETVNDAVATPVAQSVMGVSDMLYMQSTSANDGSMVLQVVFDVGTDPDLDAIFTQNNVATSTALLPSSVVTQGVVTQKTMTGFLMSSRCTATAVTTTNSSRTTLTSIFRTSCSKSTAWARSRSWAPANMPCASGSSPIC